MKRVRYVHATTAITYDARHDRVVRVTVLIDDKGRQWERYDGGPDTPIESPEDPEQNGDPNP